MLHYHLIMCIKYRNKVIDDIISNRLKEIFEKIAPAYNITLEEWNHDTDHVHILFKGQPNTEISKFINAYKSASSRLIKKEFPQIRKSLWKEMFWSQSFCLLTTGGATVDIIKQYIMSQGKKKWQTKQLSIAYILQLNKVLCSLRPLAVVVRSIILCFLIKLKGIRLRVNFRL